MFNIKRYIYETVLRQLGTSVQADKELLYRGICKYADENHLEETFQGKQAEKVLAMYLEPILEMPAQQLYDYFITQDIMHQFQSVSGAIFTLADKKYNKQAYTLETLDELERSLSSAVTDFINAGKMDAIKSELSDCYVDLAYLKGESNNISIRLMRKNRV